MYFEAARADTARGDRSPRLPMGVATTTTRPPSDVEADLEDIAVHHLVVLALDPQLARLPGRRPGPVGQQLVPVDHFGPDEAPLQVGVDHPGALGGLGTGPEGPGPALFLPGGEKGPPPEQPVGGSGHPG